MRRHTTLTLAFLTASLATAACGDGGRAMGTTASGGPGPMTAGDAGTDGGGTGGSTGDFDPTDGTDGMGGTGSSGGETGYDLPRFDVGFGTAGGAPPTCEPIDFEVIPTIPQVGLVLDASGSMNGPTTYEGQNMSRWSAVVNGVADLVDATSDRVHYGALYYPTDNYCGVGGVALPVGPNDTAAVLGSIPGANDWVTGNTPAYAAVETMFAHLQQVADGRPQAMVLLTDGVPGCANSDKVGDIIGQAAAAGIPTYVMGFSDGNNGGIDPQALDAWAKAGGTSSGGFYDFYDVADGDAVAAAFDQIITDAIPCTLPLPMPATADQADFVEVRVGGTEWPEVDGCNGLPGWTWSKEFEEITLCGSACTQLKQTKVASVTFACPEG